MREKLYKLALKYIGKYNAKWNKSKLRTDIKSLDRLTYYTNKKAYLLYGADAEWRKFSSYEVLDNAIQKLAKYEVLANQGKLMELPCKVGDIIYSIASNKIYPVKATKEVHLVNGVLHILCESCKFSDLISCEDMGRTAFLTKEEAEQALDQMKAGE